MLKHSSTERRDSYQLVRNVILSVAMMNVSKRKLQDSISIPREVRQNSKVRKGERGRWRMSATHVLSLELSRSSSGSIISEQLGQIHPNNLFMREGGKDMIPAEHLPCVDDLS